MSSNLRIVKICAYCKQEFIARKTTTETCSDPCAKRLYKIKQRGKAVQGVGVETVVKREAKAFITEDEVKAIQAKEWLTLKEAALLLNVSPLTLRRWTLAGKLQSKKVGRKHLFKRKERCDLGFVFFKAEGKECFTRKNLCNIRGISNLFNLYISVSDQWMIVNNETIVPEPVAEGAIGVDNNIINEYIWQVINDQAKRDDSQ